MKKTWFISLTSVLILAGCVHADDAKINVSDNNFPKVKNLRMKTVNKIAVLSKSCNGNQDARLAAADSLMALIMESHANSDGTVIMKKTDPSYSGSVKLYELMGRFYQDDISVDECKTRTAEIKSALLS